MRLFTSATSSTNTLRGEPFVIARQLLSGDDPEKFMVGLIVQATEIASMYQT